MSTNFDDVEHVDFRVFPPYNVTAWLFKCNQVLFCSSVCRCSSPRFLQNLLSPSRSLSRWSSLVGSVTRGAPVDTARIRWKPLVDFSSRITPVKSFTGPKYSLIIFQPFCDGAHKTKAQGLSPLRFVPEKDATVWLCGCKYSNNPPYCDGTHKQAFVLSATLHKHKDSWESDEFALRIYVAVAHIFVHCTSQFLNLDFSCFVFSMGDKMLH